MDRCSIRSAAKLQKVACWVGIMVAAGLALGARERSPRPFPRSRPPAAEWDAASTEIFAPDAFALLVGPRPDFGGPEAAGSAAAGSVGGEGTGGAGDDTDSFKWSTLISGDTLTDEIKDLKDTVATAVTSPSAFKGGGYDDARRAFSAIALAFGLIADHDEDIRWQRDASTARRLFARAGFNCKVGTDQSFAEAKLCLEDLAGMLDGNPPRRKGEEEDGFRWSNVAARPALMARLEEAEQRLAANVSSAVEFGRHREIAIHEAELVAAIGEVIRRPDFEYHDDDTYGGYAQAMRDAAVRIRAACSDKNYEAARTAVGQMSKACSDCHGEYR
jgi:hypothetical protein